MAAITMTVVGNLARDPELRYTPTGHAFASFTIASTERVRDGNGWKDGATTWVRCTAWRDLAEHAAETLHQGTRVVATGNVHQREYQDKDGSRRTDWELNVTDCGPSLLFATARVTKAAAKTARNQEEQPPW
jgi:single-strand DNA-binding protein